MADRPLDRPLITQTFEVAEEIVAAVAEWERSAKQAVPGLVALDQRQFRIEHFTKEVSRSTKPAAQASVFLDVVRC